MEFNLGKVRGGKWTYGVGYEARSVGFEVNDETGDGIAHVTVHTPLNDETRGLMNEAAFRRMKSTAIFINTSRGPVHSQEDLVNALESGQILGAGLDVFEQEPLTADSKLISMDNVVLTPHSAFYSERSNTNIKNRVGQTVAQVIAGKWPTSVATVPNRDQVIPKKRLV